MKHGFVLAGPHSGSGKTTAAVVVMAALARKGVTVQPYKVGPDYLDPGFHNLVTPPRKSRNLDSFLLDDTALRRTFLRNALHADAAVVEGVMGLYDGRGRDGTGSTAQVAKKLGLPVILVIDAKGLARSAGAILLGFKQYDPEVHVAGVIFNRVSGPKHYEYLKEAVRPEWDVRDLGFIPRDPALEIPERHLGLTSVLEKPFGPSFVEALGGAARFLDLDGLLEATRVEHVSWSGETERPLAETQEATIGVAYDEAFSFYYEDNFDLLRDAGAELVFFSPLKDPRLPEHLDALYFGGGFPEMFTPELAGNGAMMDSVRAFAGEERPVYAECGGLIYLAERFRSREGKVSHLVGLVPGEIEMTGRLQSFGYKEITARCDTFLFGEGDKLKSHEFHYSRWNAPQGDYEAPYEIGGEANGFWRGSLLASYQHLHFGSDPALARSWIAALRARKSPLGAA
jgi:cobyrinic acid a,c-diamide synthase